jgi:hypothetical protein
MTAPVISIVADIGHTHLPYPYQPHFLNNSCLYSLIHELYELGWSVELNPKCITLDCTCSGTVKSTPVLSEVNFFLLLTVASSIIYFVPPFKVYATASFTPLLRSSCDEETLNC